MWGCSGRVVTLASIFYKGPPLFFYRKAKLFYRRWPAFLSRHSFVWLYTFSACLLLSHTFWDSDDREDMLILLFIPREVALWVSAMFGNFFPCINLLEQVPQYDSDTACISPANLSAPVIINLNLAIFSWAGKKTVLRRLNVKAAIWISLVGDGELQSRPLCFFFPLEQGSPLWLFARNAL